MSTRNKQMGAVISSRAIPIDPPHLLHHHKHDYLQVVPTGAAYITDTTLAVMTEECCFHAATKHTDRSTRRRVGLLTDRWMLEAALGPRQIRSIDQCKKYHYKVVKSTWKRANKICRKQQTTAGHRIMAEVLSMAPELHFTFDTQFLDLEHLPLKHEYTKHAKYVQTTITQLRRMRKNSHQLSAYLKKIGAMHAISPFASNTSNNNNDNCEPAAEVSRLTYFNIAHVQLIGRATLKLLHQTNPNCSHDVVDVWHQLLSQMVIQFKRGYELAQQETVVAKLSNMGRELSAVFNA